MKIISNCSSTGNWADRPSNFTWSYRRVLQQHFFVCECEQEIMSIRERYQIYFIIIKNSNSHFKLSNKALRKNKKDEYPPPTPHIHKTIPGIV